MGVVMTVLAGSFAVWGINDIFRGFGRSTLAKIGNTEIPIEQFRQTYQDRLQQIVAANRPSDHAGTGERASASQRQVLSEMVAPSGLDQRAAQMRLGVSDAEISRRITTNPSFQTPNGQFDRAAIPGCAAQCRLQREALRRRAAQTTLRRQIID